MLACMDGLESNENGVVVMAATNRVDILDQARSRHAPAHTRLPSPALAPTAGAPAR